MKKIITFLYLLILAYACYDDKGNYDYREINQISIQNIDSLVLCDQMDLLSIPVTLEGTQYSDSNRFTYMWEVNQKVVTLCINGGKISARILKNALVKLLRKMEQMKREEE